MKQIFFILSLFLVLLSSAHAWPWSNSTPDHTYSQTITLNLDDPTNPINLTTLALTINAMPKQASEDSINIEAHIALAADIPTCLALSYNYSSNYGYYYGVNNPGVLGAEFWKSGYDPVFTLDPEASYIHEPSESPRTQTNDNSSDPWLAGSNDPWFVITTPAPVVTTLDANQTVTAATVTAYKPGKAILIYRATEPQHEEGFDGTPYPSRTITIKMYVEVL